VGGVAVSDLAEEYGTPLLVVDEDDIRERCREYREAFAGVDVGFAAKAWCVVGILRIVAEEGLFIDVASGGELHTAVVAGVPIERVVLHGNNKSVAELEMAADLGVGRIVVDSFEELKRIEAIGAAREAAIPVWLRVTPGIDAHTHDYVRTGHDDSKFGFTLSLGFADEAMRRAKSLAHVDVRGAHAHVGSQIFGTDAFVANAEVMAEVLARWRDELGVELDELNLGGGMGIRYNHEDHPVGPDRYAVAMLDALGQACLRLELPLPRLSIEPGRAIVGPSTVTVYTVGTVKDLPGIATYASVDGGMSDNIRPALYEAEHEVALANRTSPAQLRPTEVVGKHCESGDLVRPRAALPADVGPGDLLAVAATGAYTEAMASNYNRLPRPAAIVVHDGDIRPLLRRETLEDMVRRDVR
jgi:diaminopimelate decarboxylase